MLISSKLFRHFSQQMLVLALLMGLSACIKADRKSNEDLEQTGQTEQATFYVVPMSNPEVQPPSYDSVWALPTAANYKFKACLIDRNVRKPIIARKFIVTEGDKSHTVISDGNGCIEWTENVPFNFFADKPQYLVLERTIRGTGVDRGEQKIEFALDPWKSSRAGSHAEFIYLTRADLVEDDVAVRGRQNVFRAQSAGEEHNLIIKNLALDIQQRRQLAQGAELSVALEMQPMVRLKKMDGTYHEFDFNQGRFSVYAQIIATNLGQNQDKNFLMTPHLASESVDMKDGQLLLTFRNVPLRIFNSDGNLIFAIKVIPEGQSELKPFSAIYRLGAFNQWLGTRKPLRENEDYVDLGLSYDQLMTSLNQSAEEREAFMREANLTPLEPFRFSYFTIKYNGIKAGETATTRTVAFDVKVCVTHTLHGGIPARHKNFEVIRRPGEAPISKTTDEHGCMAWIDEVTHKYYKPEHYMVSPVVLKDVASGFQKELKIAINPWDLFATFGKDLREVEADDLRFTQGEEDGQLDKIESRFNLADFAYTAIRFDYDIKKDFSLNVKKSVLLKLFPEVQRYSSITGGRLAVERLRDGIWLLKIAIQKDYLDPATRDAIIDRENGRPTYRLNQHRDVREKQYISYQEKLVRVINGRIITPIELEMRDLRLMRIRSNMLIQLQPVDETKLQAANIYREYLDGASDIAQRMSGTLEDINLDRQAIAPDPQSRSQVDVENMSDAERAQAEQEMSVEERERYYYQRMATINRFISRLDSNQLREAIHQGDLSRINGMVHDASRFDEDGYPFEEELTKGIPYDFKTTFNREIDAGLLSAFNDQFELTQEFLNRLKLNDFTVEPAAPILSLDFLIEGPEVSGLKKRTFVGPVTFLYNSNHSEVRATDTLDEVFCLNNTCDSRAITEEQLREWSWDGGENYAWRKFYGWVAHFFNKHVDDLIFEKNGGTRTIVGPSGRQTVEKKIGLDELHEREMRAKSLLYNFVNLNDLQYVSLTDVPLKTMAKNCAEPFYDESCLVNTQDYTLKIDDFLTKLNKVGVKPENDASNPYSYDPVLGQNYYTNTQHLKEYPFTKEVLAEFIQTERLPELYTDKLCHTMVNDLIRRLIDLKFVDIFSAEPLRNDISLQCMHAGGKWTLDRENPILNVDPRYRVFETGRKMFKGGKSLNVNVNQNFTLATKESSGYKRSYDLLGLPRLIPWIGKMFSGGGLQFGDDSGRDRSLGTTVTEGAFLVVQIATFDIELTSYEKCIVVNFKHDGLAEILNRYSYRGRNAEFNSTDVAIALASGYLFCAGGEPQTDPLPVRERYYYVTQHFTEGDMLDAGDLYNHPWLLAIRGSRDFQTFMAGMHRNDDAEAVSGWDIMGDVIQGEFADQTKVKKYTWPLDQLVKTYLHVLPTFPGMYAPGLMEPRDFPWDDSPADSFALTGAGLGGNYKTEVPVNIPEGLVDVLGSGGPAEGE